MGEVMAEGLAGLRIYQLAEVLSDEIWDEVIRWKPFARNTVGCQLVEAADSVGGNIAEGYGRYSQAAYRNHVSIARGSAFEVESWLDLLIRRHYVSEEQGDRLLVQVIEVQRLLTLKMKSLGDGKTYAINEEPFKYHV